NDLVAAAFQLVENFGQREDGAGVNVVQQQDTLAARLDTADGASRNLAIVDAGPVVRQEIRAPSHIAMGREVLLDRLLAHQTRYPKERRHRLRVADGLAQRRKTLFDFARRLIHRHFANGMVLGVVGNSVALVMNATHHRRIGARHLPDHEEGRLHTFRCEGFEDAAGVTPYRTIVERQHRLMSVSPTSLPALGSFQRYSMEPTRGGSLGSPTSVRLTPSAPGGHCSASAVPISKTRMAHDAIVPRMILFPLCRPYCGELISLLLAYLGYGEDRCTALKGYRPCHP